MLKCSIEKCFDVFQVFALYIDSIHEEVDQFKQLRRIGPVITCGGEFPLS